MSLEDDGFRGVLVYSHRRTPHFQEDPQNSSRVSHSHVSRQLCQAAKGARMLMPFTMMAGGRALSLLPFDGDRYSVFFQSSREQIEFDKSQLRLHREWVYGKWTKMWNFRLPFSVAFFGEL
ncbi:Uncharacterized protein Adt_25487 [Abeliophyllum distichum]|uniref:Uncharacterized protein n=1 Tax=Abeliophyllum distichum TaxID=126358 RepID=A0ABD1SGS7_9LAMI